MKPIVFVLIVFSVVCCKTNTKYHPLDWHSPAENDSLMVGIITRVYSPPLYTSMAERFAPQHRAYYAGLLSKFKMVQYYVDGDGVNFFYLLRPAAKVGDQMGVGGKFRLDKNNQITEFRELFVTPVMPEAELRTKCLFLFDDMVKGKLGPDLEMSTYVQWPNRASYYDTVLYQWKLNKDSIN